MLYALREKDYCRAIDYCKTTLFAELTYCLFLQRIRTIFLLIIVTRQLSGEGVYRQKLNLYRANLPEYKAIPLSLFSIFDKPAVPLFSPSPSPFLYLCVCVRVSTASWSFFLQLHILFWQNLCCKLHCGELVLPHRTIILEVGTIQYRRSKDILPRSQAFSQEFHSLRHKIHMFFTLSA